MKDFGILSARTCTNPGRNFISGPVFYGIGCKGMIPTRSIRRPGSLAQCGLSRSKEVLIAKAVLKPMERQYPAGGFWPNRQALSFFY